MSPPAIKRAGVWKLDPPCWYSCLIIPILRLHSLWDVDIDVHQEHVPPCFFGCGYFL